MFIRPGTGRDASNAAGRSCFRCGRAERPSAVSPPSLKSNQDQGGACSERERLQTSSHRETWAIRLGGAGEVEQLERLVGHAEDQLLAVALGVAADLQGHLAVEGDLHLVAVE